MPEGLRLGVPLPGQRLFFGDRASEALYEASLAQFAELGAKIVEIDIEPFYAAARLLYEGPWVAERYLTARALIASSPESLHPVTRQIILAGAHGTAADAFAAFYQLEDLRRVRDHMFRAIDAMVLPTAPTIYTVEQVLADPIGLNSRLGTYTNFVNLLDMCGLAVPASMRADGTPFGVTLLAPAGEDAALAAIGREFHAATGLPLGALEHIRSRRSRAAGGGGPRRDSARGGRRASFRHAAQRRIARARRAADRARRDRAALPALCASRHAAAEARLAAREKRRRRRHRDRSLGAFGKRLRPVCRRRAAALVDRHARTRRRPPVKGFLVEAEAVARRARYFKLRRLARLHGAGKVRRKQSRRDYLARR